MTGQVVAHYRVLEELGSGGMGVIYRAQDLRLKRDVALKFLPASVARDVTSQERFRREAEAVSALNHPHICTLYDVGEHEGRQFLVLELLEGGPLNRLIAAGPLPVDRIVALSIQIADALAAAHAKGIVHRDIKPSNVWITARGDAKVLDFGIAKLTDPSAVADARTESPLTMTGARVGTPNYMSPEQRQGALVDARTDLYALGLVMFELATGRPYEVTRASQINPAIPPEFDDIIRKSVEPHTAMRYQSATELLGDLRRVTARDSAPPRSQLVSRRRPQQTAVYAVAAAIVAAIVIATVLWTRRNSDATSIGSASEAARLVVLPFENLSRQPADDWLASAFADALSTALQPVERLTLVPRERVVELYVAESRADAQPLSSDLARQISRRLRVRYYVHGSYQRAGENLRVTARLVDADRDSIEAQEGVTGVAGNLFALEDELAAHFAARFGSREGVAARSESPPLDAYQAVVDARAFYALSRWAEARQLLQRAVDRAPRYATAWAWLSKTDSRSAAPAAAEAHGVRESMQRALTEATTAVTLQPELVESQIALALAYRGLEMVSAQRQAAERAVALDPRNGEARVVLGDANAMSAGFGCPEDPRPEAAEAAFREGMRIDPLYAQGRQNLATHLWWMNRPTEALAAMQEGLALQPDNVAIKLWLPFNLAFASRADEAFVMWQRNTANAALRPVDSYIAGMIELKRGRFDVAAAHFDAAGQQLTERVPFGVMAGLAELQAGRVKEGARYLERTLRGPTCAVWFDRVPVFAPYKNAPEVRAVIAKLR